MIGEKAAALIKGELFDNQFGDILEADLPIIVRTII